MKISNNEKVLNKERRTNEVRMSFSRGVATSEEERRKKARTMAEVFNVIDKNKKNVYNS